jgi:hypothetical protein
MRDQIDPRALEDASQRLDEPPSDDDLDDLLESAAPRRRSKLTTGLFGVLIFLVGFFLGSSAEKVVDAVREQAAAGSAGTETTLPQDGLPILTGTIEVVEDGLIYVERADGAVVKVWTESTTLVGLSRAAEITDLAPGDQILVHGTRAEDGSVTATRIQQG